MSERDPLDAVFAAALRQDREPLPEGFAERAAREAMAAESASSNGLLDKLIAFAIPTAAVSVVGAIALALTIGLNGELEPLDPVSDIVDVPDATETLIGVGE